MSVGVVAQLRHNSAALCAKHPLIGHTVGVNESEQVDYDLQPRALTTLKRGGQQSGYVVEAIITAQSQLFSHNGKRWLRAVFHQKETPPKWKQWLFKLKQWLTKKPAVSITALTVQELENGYSERKKNSPLTTRPV